jgi:hypothetical protein
MVRGSSLRNLLAASGVLAVVALAAPCEFGSQGVFGREPILFGDPAFDPYAGNSAESEIRRLQVLPDGLIYHPYLAGPKESRTGFQFFSNDEGGWSWYGTVGGQVGILRYGTYDEYRPVGIQFDIEGSAQFRSTGSDILEFESTDVRFGFPVSLGWGSQETKLALYFLRAEPNRNFFESRPEQPERIFERQAIVLGHSIHLSEKLRLYGEAGYAFKSDLSGEWEFQFGAEYAPVLPTRIWGAPFAAANLYLLEQEDFGGNLTLQAGWGWRGKNARLLRAGVFYSNGLSNSFVLEDRNEQQFGFGIWHDF